MATEYGEGGGLTVTMDGPFAGSGGSVKITTISAPVADWKGAESPRSQSVAVDGVSTNSKVDVQLSPEQMVQFKGQTIVFLVENNGGNTTLYAFGDKPSVDCVLQVTVMDTLSEGVILGDVASTVAARANYGQTDATKSDYILNKPDAAIEKAQKTADNAAALGAAALPKSGGTMTGSLDMGGNKLANLPTPEADTDAVTKGFVTGYVDGKHLSATLTLPASGWSETAPYTQTVALGDILATDMPHYSVVYSADTDTALAQKEAFALVDELETAEGSLTFSCFEERPEINLTIQLEVNR